jgi:heme-degrading monooxygenase HmoA
MRPFKRSTLLTLLCAVLAGGIPGRSAAPEASGLMALSARPGAPVIARVWHGRTVRAKADAYEEYISSAIKKFPTIKGNLGYQLMRIDGGPDGDAYVEFQVVSYWESLDSIKAYAGEDIRRTHDLPRDKEFLTNMEPFVRNYELKVNAIRP